MSTTSLKIAAEHFPVPLRSNIDPGCLAAVARTAMIAELALTPKPGLVDRRGSGCHTDMYFETMQLSAQVIEPYFGRMATMSLNAPRDQRLRERLGVIGRDAEAAMLRATSGVNTHRGAIWAIGLLISTTASTGLRDPRGIADAAGRLAVMVDRFCPKVTSHGSEVSRRYGAAGARVEAQRGFPSVVSRALPALRLARSQGCDESASQLHALLSIMSGLDDTCVLHRGGVRGLRLVKEGALAVLIAGGPGSSRGDAELAKFDACLAEHHLSPGGSADLLAAALFLDAVERQLDTEVVLSKREEIHGAV